MYEISETMAIEIFSDNLRDIMNDAQINQSELAIVSHLTQGTISKYLKKQQMPTMKAIMNLCYALSCSYQDLLPEYYLVR